MNLPIVSVTDFASEYPTVANYLPADWRGTALDILNMTNCPASVRLCVVMNLRFMSAKVLRLFATACARNALRKAQFTDPLSMTACDVAEKFANNEATDAELATARREWRSADNLATPAERAAKAARATTCYWAADAAWHASHWTSESFDIAASGLSRFDREWQITILKALLSTKTAATAPHQRKTAEAEFFFGKSSKGHDKEWWDKYAD